MNIAMKNIGMAQQLTKLQALHPAMGRFLTTTDL